MVTQEHQRLVAEIGGQTLALLLIVGDAFVLVKSDNRSGVFPSIMFIVCLLGGT
jgi:hypothetical protein